MKPWVRFLAVLAALIGSAHAKPYTPASDDEVLERLPPGSRSSELRRQREALASDPENLRDSVAMAEGYAEIARVEGDARYLGYAQSILGPWWHQPSPPAGVLRVRGEVRAAKFEFDRALVDLQAALTAEPAHARARIVRFQASLARADFAGAESFWKESRPHLSALASTTGDARLARITGNAPAAFRSLSNTLASSQDVDPVEYQEAMLLAADVALQLGRTNDAAAYFSTLRRLGRRDVERLAAEAEFLLDQGRPREVVGLLVGQTGTDSLALRYLEAWSALPDPTAGIASERESMLAQLAQKLEDRRGRGDAAALPDQVRLRLRLRPEPQLAVERARELWAIRRELRDARLLLEAARIAQDKTAAAPVLDWLRLNRVSDARLDSLLETPALQ